MLSERFQDIKSLNCTKLEKSATNKPKDNWLVIKEDVKNKETIIVNITNTIPPY